MGTSAEDKAHEGLVLFLVVIGILSLLAGIGILFMGPAEMYCFYLFSEGGPFYYEGFGFGAFMFGNIASQIMGYYAIGLVLIVVGYGHLRLRRWVRPLTLALMGAWLVVGAPVSIVFMLVFMTSKDPDLASALIMLPVLALMYPVLPGLLIWFYRSRRVRTILETRDPQSHGIEEIPLPVLALSVLCLFYIVALHVPILFNGIFPLFGIFMYGFPGIFLLDIAILCLAGLLWGLVRLKTWAWWGSLVYFGLLTISATATFARSSLPEILARMRFAPLETDALQNVPLQGMHLAVFFGLPLLITLGLVIYSKRYFGRERRFSSLDNG